MPVLGLVLALLPLLGPVVLVIELASEPDELHVIEQTMTRAEGPGTYRPPWAAVADDEAHPVEADSEQLVPDSASDTEEPETGGEQEAELDPS
ncbi:MAG: hypothetical protein JSV80_03390 [Acidobacteriota bacterium]|nr:MAG: hypothetical protein JSV80_03390 [Acidobacteriota bacterium]